MKTANVETITKLLVSSTPQGTNFDILDFFGGVGGYVYKL